MNGGLIVSHLHLLHSHIAYYGGATVVVAAAAAATISNDTKTAITDADAVVAVCGCDEVIELWLWQHGYCSTAHNLFLSILYHVTLALEKLIIAFNCAVFSVSLEFPVIDPGGIEH